MTADQLRRRDAAHDRHDAALDRWPDAKGEDFRAEVTIVARDLEAIAREAEATAAHPLELGRCLRYLGAALFNLGEGTDVRLLTRAVAAYRRAEPLLRSNADLSEIAKFEFNFANALRGVSGGLDATLLEQARERFARSLEVFQRSLPAFAGAASDALGLVKRQLAALKEKDRIEGQIEDIGAKIKDLQHQLEASRARDAADAERDRFMVRALCDALSREVAAGKVQPERERTLLGILADFDAVVAMPDDTEAQMTRRLGILRELWARSQFLLREPSTGRTLPPAGSRARSVLELLNDIVAAFGAQLNVANGVDAADAKRRLFVRLVEGQTGLYSLAADDDGTRVRERETLRALAADARAHLRRAHLTLATPIWPSPPVAAESSRVVVFGGARVSALVQTACTARGLDVQRDAPGSLPSQAMWDGLRRAGVVVVDLSDATAAGRASAAYALGVALALGRPLVVLGAAAGRLPFDVEQQPVALTGGDVDQASIGDALDRALYTAGLPASETSVDATIRYAVRRYHTATADVTVRRTLDLLTDAGNDAVAAARSLGQLLSFAHESSNQIVCPVWPGGYPDPEAPPRCFHVMPFREAWSDEARDAVRSACRAPWEYVRGDEPDDPRIIRSIWDKITRASLVVVDLTGFNSNVLIELALADSLGRPVQLVAQSGTETLLEATLPAIAKRRVATYQAGHGAPQLRHVVESALARGRG